MQDSVIPRRGESRKRKEKKRGKKLTTTVEKVAAPDDVEGSKLCDIPQGGFVIFIMPPSKIYPSFLNRFLKLSSLLFLLKLLRLNLIK